jgi:hypothetical protein
MLVVKKNEFDKTKLKGSLISKGFSCWLKSPKKGSNHYLFYLESAKDSDLAHFLKNFK